jgi:hypothetical protein
MKISVDYTSKEPKLTVMKQPNPIAVRPRQGSKLEKVWEQNERSTRAMGDIIHSWADQFAVMVNASEREEEK